MTTGVAWSGTTALDPRLEVPARHVDGAGNVPLVPFVLFAHVDPDRTFELRRLAGVDLDDPFLNVF